MVMGALNVSDPSLVEVRALIFWINEEQKYSLLRNDPDAALIERPGPEKRQPGRSDPSGKWLSPRRRPVSPYRELGNGGSAVERGAWPFEAHGAMLFPQWGIVVSV